MAGWWFFMTVFVLAFLVIVFGLSPEGQRAVRIFYGACP